MSATKYIIIFILLRSSAFGQNEKWTNTAGWKLYSTSPKNLDTLVKDSLYKYPSIELNHDTISHFLKAATLIPAERTNGAVWMGAYWTSYQIGQSIYMLKVSNYGGFFIDESNGLYYELPMEDRKSWLDYLSHQSILLKGRKYTNP